MRCGLDGFLGSSCDGYRDSSQLNACNVSGIEVCNSKRDCMARGQRHLWKYLDSKPERKVD